MEENYQAQQMPQSSPEIGFPSQPSPKQGGNLFKILILVIGLILIVGAGGFFLLRGDSESDDLMSEPTPNNSLSDLPTSTPEPSPSPTTTASPTPVKKSEIQISVLNGTGVPGEASLLKKELEKLGYTKIEAGNASEQKETRTTVTYSSTISDSVASELTKMLETMYTEVRTKKGAVTGGDIEILTGPRKSATKASASPTPKAISTASPAPSSTPSGN